MKLPDVPALNWEHIEKEVKSRLSCFEDLNLSSLAQRSGQPDVASLGKVFSLKREQWFYAFYYGENDDALPTLLPTSSLCGVHNVLVGLHSLRGRFDHTTNIKNEGNPYYFPTSEKIARLSEL